MANSKWRERRRRLALLLFGLIFGLAIAEIALRIIGYSYPEFYVTDSAARFRRVAELFLGRPLESVETVELGAI